MLISISKRFVFVANTKTGSSTITSALAKWSEIKTKGSPKRKHMSWNEARKEYGFIFERPDYSPESFFRFGVIREPADWVRSWYNYLRFHERVSDKLKKFPAEMTFEEFWHDVGWIKKISQKSAFVDRDGCVRFDLIIPLEELKSALPVLLAAMNVASGQVEDKNVSKGTLSREDVAPVLWEEINRYYADDYSFYLESKESYQHALQLGLIKIAAIKAQDQSIDKVLMGEIKLHDSPVGKGILPCTESETNLKVTQQENRSVLVALLDKGIAVNSKNLANLRGVVLLKPDAYEGSKLVIIDANGQTKDVSWGRPSSGLTKKFPANERASHARFMAQGVLLMKGKAAEIALVDANQKTSSIFKVERT